MSYYFTILSPTDVPLFNIAFGTSKSGGDGIARFRFPEAAQNTYMTQFIIHSSLDMLEEAQWMGGNMYVLLLLCYTCFYLFPCFVNSIAFDLVDIGIAGRVQARS
jgi:hypothetical protein